MFDPQPLLSGNRLALARALTQLENQSEQAAAMLAALHPHAGKAHLIGVTGAPGTGKSSVVNELAKVLRKQGRTVAIVAVDPTSPFTGGAILGDRIRMRDLTGDPGVFIRSMAARGSLGGLARATADVVVALDAAGFNEILIETVGAGQSEVDIARTAHTTVVVEAPGLGDDVQGIKAGILEIADILAVNKADLPGTPATVRALRASLELGHPVTRQWMEDRTPTTPAAAHAFWLPPILEMSAIQSQGIEALAEAIAKHRAYLEETGEWQHRERDRVTRELHQRVREALFEALVQKVGAPAFARIIDRIQHRELDPLTAVRELLAQ